MGIYNKPCVEYMLVELQNYGILFIFVQLFRKH